MNVSVVYSDQARQVHQWQLDLALGATLADACCLSGVLQAFPELQLPKLSVGVWSRKASLDHVLQADDRVEIYRPLQVDPKVARRERFKRQGVKRAGLFAKTRVGAKAGY